MALSIQLLKGAARLAYSRCSWSMVSSCFSVFWCVWAGTGPSGEVSRQAGGWRSGAGSGEAGGSRCHPPPTGPQGHRAPRVTSPPPHLQSFPATLGQRAKGVPLVADLLAAGVDVVRVIVVQLTAGGARGHETRRRAAGGGVGRLGPPGPWCQVTSPPSPPPQTHALPKAGGMQMEGSQRGGGGSVLTSCENRCHMRTQGPPQCSPQPCLCLDCFCHPKVQQSTLAKQWAPGPSSLGLNPDSLILYSCDPSCVNSLFWRPQFSPL